MIYNRMIAAKSAGKKQFAVLIDPDKFDEEQAAKLLEISIKCPPDYFFVGGSLMIDGDMNEAISLLKQQTEIPVIIFPGSIYQVNKQADAILFLSLISGRNPDYLIGSQVIAAPYVKKANLEPIATGYMLVDGGKATTASYMSGAQPIPSNKSEIAACTAMAGEMLGLKCIYADAGSGAINTVPAEMVKAISNSVAIPLIVGGGIRDVSTAIHLAKNGADVLVIGNAIESNVTLVEEIYHALNLKA